jgi:hypothetical protein
MAKRLGAGVYAIGEYTIERIDSDHECAELVAFTPCWRVDDGREVLGEYETKREAIEACGKGDR